MIADVEDSDADDIRGVAAAVRTVVSFLRPYFRLQWSNLSLLLLAALVETGYNVAFPLSLKYLIDDALYEEDKAALVGILIVLGILAIVISGVSFLQEY